MEEKMKELLSEFEFNEPALAININKVEGIMNITFPKDYYDFLLHSNGGEGLIGQSYLILWKIEELIELNNDYGVEEFSPGLFIIGSDGGGTAYCIDIRSDSNPFVQVPFIGLDLSAVEVCSNDFKGFLTFLSKE